MINVSYAIILGVLLFAVGLYGVLRSTNAVRILMCIELMLNAVNIVFVGFGRLIETAGIAAGASAEAASATAVTGQVFSIFIMAVAAAEAAVGLAIILQVVRQRGVVQVDKINLLKG